MQHKEGQWKTREENAKADMTKKNNRLQGKTRDDKAKQEITREIK